MYIQSRIKQAEFRGFTREDGYLCARMCVQTHIHKYLTLLLQNILKVLILRF